MAKTIKINGVNFTELTGEKAHSLVREYRYAEKRGIYLLQQAYGRFSYAKELAYNECIDTMMKVGGSAYYISGYNSCFFSFVYLVRDAKYKDYVYIVKETYANRYFTRVHIGALR